VAQNRGNNLLKVLDNTVSPMGARLLKRWMVLPLLDIKKINERLDLVEYFIKKQIQEKIFNISSNNAVMLKD
jgi:DNA mismatch repair protein MutS